MGNLANLDFLASESAVLVNLIPDKEGRIQIARDALGSHQYIRVVAIDPISTTSRSVSLPDQKTQFVDLRMEKGLDPKGHFTQQKQINIVPVGETFTLHDITTSKFEAYDSLSRPWLVFNTQS